VLPSTRGNRATAAGLLGRIAKRPPLMLVTGSAGAGEGRGDVTRQVQILAFDGMEVLDYAGPYEVFTVAGEQTSPAAFTVQAVGVSPRPAGRGGFAVVPVCHYSQAPPAGILVIPGGAGTRPLMGDQALLAWIAGRAAGAELVMTVCTGALLAAASNVRSSRFASH
jgi:putative intracellular protease/amidase